MEHQTELPIYQQNQYQWFLYLEMPLVALNAHILPMPLFRYFGIITSQKVIALSINDHVFLSFEVCFLWQNNFFLLARLW